MDDSLAAEVRTWLDKCKLAELVAELSSAVDRCDRGRISACYAETSHDDHGLFEGTGREFADFICRPGAMRSMHHLLGQSLFDIRGDEAWGETFFVFHGTAAGDALVSGCGRYVDYFKRIERSWKLAYRRVVPDRSPAGDDQAAYWPSRRDRSDPSYDRLRSPEESKAHRANVDT